MRQDRDELEQRVQHVETELAEEREARQEADRETQPVVDYYQQQQRTFEAVREAVGLENAE